MIRIVNTLPLQLRDNYVRRPFFRRIANGDYLHVKPHRTGLWTSTYTPDEEQPCDWLRWCVDEDFRLHKWQYGYMYEVRKGLRIIEINSQEDLHAVNDKYGEVDKVSVICAEKYPGHPIHRWPNWEKLARHFDAVHLTGQGEADTRMPHTGDNLYGWDCESTLWLNLHRNTLKFVRKIPFGFCRTTLREERELREISRRQMKEWMDERELRKAVAVVPDVQQ